MIFAGYTDFNNNKPSILLTAATSSKQANEGKRQVINEYYNATKHNCFSITIGYAVVVNVIQLMSNNSNNGRLCRYITIHASRTKQQWKRESLAAVLHDADIY